MPGENGSQEWMNYPEAEEYSGLSHTTLWRCIKRGEIKAARIGRAVRINRKSLEDFMGNHAVQLRLFDPDETD